MKIQNKNENNVKQLFTWAVTVKPVLGLTFSELCAVEVPADTRRWTSGYVGTERQTAVTAHHVWRESRKWEFHGRGRSRHLDRLWRHGFHFRSMAICRIFHYGISVHLILHKLATIGSSTLLYCVISKTAIINSNNKSAQSNLGTGPRRGSCARRWLT